MHLVDPRGAGTMRRFLVEGERMVVVHRPHWACLGGTFFALFAGLVITVFIGFTAPAKLGPITNALWYVLLAMLVYALATTWMWSRDWFVATDQRLIWRRGILNQKTAMMPLSKVTDMSFNQPAIGRILGYGEFVMESAGQEQALRLIPYIPHPEPSYRAICGQLFGHHGPDPVPLMVPTTDAYGDDHRDDTDPFLPRAGVRPAGSGAAAPLRSHPPAARVPESDIASRLGTYVDRYRDKARTPLRERLLRGPQTVEASPEHESSTELDEPFMDGAWSISTEDVSPTHRVDRRRH